MPVEFLTDEQAASYGRFVSTPSRAELERFFFLDDVDKGLIGKRREDCNRLGFSLQLGTVRLLGTFLVDPTDVPTEAVDYVAEQLGVKDPSCLKAYAWREKTGLEHQWVIAREYGYRDFADAETELEQWIEDRAWTTGEGPKALFNGAVGWLRERRILLPGVSVLARLVARVRHLAIQRLWDVLAGAVSPAQARQLELLLEVPAGARVSDLERLRQGPRNLSGLGMVKALHRVSEIAGRGLRSVAPEAVPHRRIVELARWGMAGKAPALRRHPYSRKIATLLATVLYLEVKATDDAIEFFDTLMTTELLARAERESKDDKLRRYPLISRDAAKCAAAVEVLLSGEETTVVGLWEAIEKVVSRSELQTAVTNLNQATPPRGTSPDGEWRSVLVGRFASVRGFLPMLTDVIKFGATTDAAPVLKAMQDLPELLAIKPTKPVPSGLLDERRAATDLVSAGWWQQLVFRPDRPKGTVDKAAYVFCLLGDWIGPLAVGA